MHPRDGQRGLLCHAEKRLRQYLILPQLFVLGGNKVQPDKNMVLTKAEKQLIEVIRSLVYGEVRVVIKDNKPIRMEEIRKSIQLPEDK